MLRGFVQSRRIADALGTDTLSGIGPLLVRAIRARLLHENAERLSSGSDFDRRFGVSTSGKIPLSALDIDSDNRAAGTRYEPTAPTAFSEMMAALPQKIIPRATFIDIGCGTGRVLLMAAERGFRKIIGIDFAADLCLIARGNVEQYRRCSNNSAAICIEQKDACTYDIPNQPGVLFLYNPFNESVMRCLVANVERSLSQHPREFYVVYHMPLWNKVWDASPIFSKLAGTHIWSPEWYSIYSCKLILQSRGAT
jgi:SAM-dependent methyltransferase